MFRNSHSFLNPIKQDLVKEYDGYKYTQKCLFAYVSYHVRVLWYYFYVLVRTLYSFILKHWKLERKDSRINYRDCICTTLRKTKNNQFIRLSFHCNMYSIQPSQICFIRQKESSVQLILHTHCSLQLSLYLAAYKKDNHPNSIIANSKTVSTWFLLPITEIRTLE